MEVSSREVCYGYSCNLCLCLCFVECKQCSCLWIRGLKRQERKWSGAACGNAFIRARACSNMLVLVLIMYFHQGTALWQWCCTCTCIICNMLVAMSFIRARACVSVLVLVIVIGWCACGNVLSTGHWLAKGKVALKLCTNRRLLTAHRCILYILVHCKFYLKKGTATS